MKLQDIKRKGKIENLWQLVRILDCILWDGRDKKIGTHILPLCIVFNKMFKFDITRAKERYYVCYEGKVYNPESLISCSYLQKGTTEYEINDMDYAWLSLFTHITKLDVNILIKEPYVATEYKKMIDDISNWLKKFERNEYDSYGYDVYGYDKLGFDKHQINKKGEKKNTIYVDPLRIKKSEHNHLKGPCTTIKSPEPILYSERKIVSEDYSLYKKDRTMKQNYVYAYTENGEEEIYSSDNVRRQIEEDYEINLDDMESDYYEDNSPDNYDDYYEEDYSSDYD